MTDPSFPNQEFSHFNSYGAYLLAYCLDEATLLYLEYAKKIKVPLLSRFSHLKEEELQRMVKDSLKTFFEQLEAGTALDHSKEILLKWRANTLPNVPRNGVEVSDLVLTYHARKQMLLSLVHLFTQQPHTIIAIAQEMDLFFSELEKFAFGEFIDLKNEEHKNFNLLLLEEQVKLEEAFKELKTSREELQEVNLELLEQINSRKATEEILEKERNFLQAILENISDGIVACDELGVLSYFNKATRMLHGIPEKPLPSEQWSSYYNLYKPDGKTHLAKEEVPLYRAYAGETFEGVVMVVVTPSGSKQTLLAKGKPIRSATGKTLGAVVMMQDVTTLKQAQQAQEQALNQLYEKNQELEVALEELRSAEEQLVDANSELEARIAARTRELQHSELQMRLITDALPVLITYVDADERYRFNNKAYEEWFAKPREEVYGKKLEEIMGSEAYVRVKSTVERVLQGETIKLETRLTYKQAGPKDVSIDYIPHIVGEKVMGYFALITDISAHKKTEEALLHANQEVASLLIREKEAYAKTEMSRSQLHNLFMQAPALMCIVRGHDFVFELANAAYLEVIGARGAIEGKAFTAVIPDADPAILSLLRQVMSTGESFVGQEIPMTIDWQRNGSLYTRYFNFIYNPLREPDGTISGIIGFGYEVSAHVLARQELESTAALLKISNQQLSQKNTELNKTNNDLDNFVYTASHDLRSPVVNLEGLVLTLKQHLRNPATKNPDAVIGMMEASISKLNKTIRDLTEITKAQKGLEEPEEKVSLKNILDELKADLQNSIVEANPVFLEDLQVTTITYAPRNLRSILYNLLTNALKYRSVERPLRISIRSYVEEGQVILAVQDNGLGLSEQQLPKLFTMFKRLHTHVEGTGIGLYIVKRIVENSGGRIEVSSTPDVGTLFKVCLTTAEQAAVMDQSLQ